MLCREEQQCPSYAVSSGTTKQARIHQPGTEGGYRVMNDLGRVKGVGDFLVLVLVWVAVCLFFFLSVLTQELEYRKLNQQEAC